LEPRTVSDSPQRRSCGGDTLPGGSPQPAARRCSSARPPAAGPGVEALRVLAIEDNPVDRQLLDCLLNNEVTGLSVDWTGTVAEGLEKLAARSFDAVLLDFSLPDASGLDGLQRLRRQSPRVPILFLTGTEDEDVGKAALFEGAQEYLVKGRVRAGSIVRAVRYAVERQRHKNEIDRVRLEQLELKSQILSAVSHELRTPLAAIQQLASVLHDGLAGPLDHVQLEYTQLLLDNTRRLQRLIGDLLDASRVETGKVRLEPVAVSLDALVASVVAMMMPAATEQGARVISEIPAALPEVLADPGRLEQVLVNLVDNALRHGRAGLVRITATRRNQDRVEVAVADDGSGIEPGTDSRIFERFVQGNEPGGSRASGLGLGLFICRRLIERQGGEMWLATSSGQGSTFAFTLAVAGPHNTGAATTGGIPAVPDATLDQALQGGPDYAA